MLLNFPMMPEECFKWAAAPHFHGCPHQQTELQGTEHPPAARSRPNGGDL